jgi:DNA-binding FadR family transcriptional regulator
MVRRPRPNDLTEALTLILQFEGATFIEVMEARMWLEPSVARWAASRIGEDAIRALKQTNEEIEPTGEDDEEMTSANRRFHSIISANCGNVILRIFAETLLRIADGRSVGISYGPRQVAAIVESHRAIIDALERHDEDAAEAAMNAHLEESAVYWRRKFSDALERPIRWTS